MTLRAVFIVTLGFGLRALAQGPTDPVLPPLANPLSDVPVATNWHARFEEFGDKIFGVQEIVQTVPVALFDDFRNFPHEWGQEPEALFDRLGSQSAQFVLDQSIQLALWGVHREDSHYFRDGQGNFFKRTGHALKSTIVVSDTAGGQTLALGAIAGSYGSWAIATQWWEPRSEQNAQQIMLWGSAGLIGKAASNFFHEFWPDARRKIFPHHKQEPLAAWYKTAP